MLSYFAVSSWALLLGYWSHHWSRAVALVLLAHVLVFGIWDANGAGGISSDIVREAVVFRPVAIAIVAVLGSTLAKLIEAPKYMKQPTRGWLYDILCLSILGVWAGTGCAWTYLPRAWWNHLCVCIVPQFLAWLFSLLLLDHERVFKVEPNTVTVFIVHWQYLILWAMHSLTFALGETLRDPQDVWPFYYVVAFTGAASLYMVVSSTARRVKIWTQIPVSLSEDDGNVH